MQERLPYNVEIVQLQPNLSDLSVFIGDLVRGNKKSFILYAGAGGYGVARAGDPVQPGMKKKNSSYSEPIPETWICEAVVNNGNYSSIKVFRKDLREDLEILLSSHRLVLETA